MRNYCCDDFEYHSAKVNCCEHLNGWECPDIVLGYLPSSGRYVIPTRDGGKSGIVINHCPWCGYNITPGTKSLWE